MLRQASTMKRLVFLSLAALAVCSPPRAESIPVVPAEPPGPILRVMTWNVSLREFLREDRASQVKEHILKSLPHVVAFQEMTPEYYRILQSDPRFSEIYRLIPSHPQAMKGRLAVATRLPVVSNRAYPLPGRMGRYAQHTIFRIPLEAANAAGPYGRDRNGQAESRSSHEATEKRNHNEEGMKRLSIINLHLESYLEDGPIRARQLKAIRNLVQPPSIVLGDLNFGDGPEAALERGALPPGYRDVWKEKHGSVPGLTWDQERNPLSNLFKFEGEQSRRLDYILLYEDRWKIRDVRLIGTSPVLEYRGRPVPPSDHYSVMAELQLPVSGRLALQEKKKPGDETAN